MSDSIIITFLESTHLFHTQNLWEQYTDYHYFTDVETDVHII